MTNKEAKEKLYMEWQKFLEDNIDYAGISEAYKIAFKALEQEDVTWIVGNDNAQIAVKNMPIDKLQKICAIIGDEQESVLDKIRAEIEQITDTMGVSYNQYVSKIDVLKIIDKYKAESEEKA